MSGSNFNPQNTQCIPACPVGPEDRTGVVKIFAFLGLEPRLNIKYGFNWAGKIEHFSKVSHFNAPIHPAWLRCSFVNPPKFDGESPSSSLAMLRNAEVGLFPKPSSFDFKLVEYEVGKPDKPISLFFGCIAHAVTSNSVIGAYQ